jgi:flagellar biosynthesis/type III secretory pathway protein FliH
LASVIETEFAGEIEAYISDLDRIEQEAVDAAMAKAQPELIALREAVGKFQEKLDEARKEGRAEGYTEGEKAGASEMLAILKRRKKMF